MDIENKEVKEVIEETVKAEEAASPVMKASTAAKRDKKKSGREAKAMRKEANRKEEKKTRPNNIILAVMIFGVIIAMFAFVKCYNYFSKPATIEAYLEENGGEDTYGSMAMDAYTTAALTAEGNSMNIVMNSKIDSSTDGADEIIDEITDYYKSDDGEEYIKYIGAYYLTTIKPEVRGSSADVSVTVNVNDKEAGSAEMTYKEAKQFLEDLEKESEEESEADDDGSSDGDDADADGADEADDAGSSGDQESDSSDSED